MILTSNSGFAKWGQVFGDPVVATALLDRTFAQTPCSPRRRSSAAQEWSHRSIKRLITKPAKVGARRLTLFLARIVCRIQF
jgi:hypothetical protein